MLCPQASPGLYLLVSDEELPVGLSYEVVLIGTMKQDLFDDPDARRQAMEFFNQIESALANCDGIDMTDSDLRSETGVSIADLEYLKRWDYDDLTFRAGDPDGFPADDR